MSEIMKLGDIHDMERYLSEDCYCPGEIYDISGFFYEIFKADDECVLIAESEGMTAVVAKSGTFDNSKPQAIMFWHDDNDRPGRIIAARRIDATENNIDILRTIVHGGKPDGRKIDEFKPGSRAKALNNMLSISNLVIRD